MTKKHFIALADVLIALRPPQVGSHELQRERDAGKLDQWKDTRNALGDFCQSQNGNFNRDRWLAYIAGQRGPNGGAIKQ